MVICPGLKMNYNVTIVRKTFFFCASVFMSNVLDIGTDLSMKNKFNKMLLNLDDISFILLAMRAKQGLNNGAKILTNRI